MASKATGSVFPAGTNQLVVNVDATAHAHHEADLHTFGTMGGLEDSSVIPELPGGEPQHQVL